MSILKRILLCLIGICLSTTMHGVTRSTQADTDPLIVSLLTCTPGTETYSKYGHSAIRIQDKRTGKDWTFNYGVFNFESDHFYARFVKGDTRYQLAAEPTGYFVESNHYIGRNTCEQVLNLTREQKEQLFEALLTNYEPQNRYYLYNFVFDNCATRPYRLLRTVLGEELQTPEFANRKDTYRQLIRYYSEKHSWTGFGIDFIFGKDADRIMTTEERLFLPEQLMDYVSEATFPDGRKLCLKEHTEPFLVWEHGWRNSPEMVVLLLCVLIGLITIVDLCNSKISWWLDGALFLGGGILGLLASYLSFFSLHPLVGHNWNLLLVNPLLLILFLLTLFGAGRKILQKGLIGIGIFFLVAMALRTMCGQEFHALLYIPLLHALRMTALGVRNMHTNKPEKNRRLPALLLVLFLSVLHVSAQPKLTVVVCVDGLHQQSLEELRNYWPQGGLRMLEEEAHKSVVSFPHLVWGGSETLATLCTGTTPSRHGIGADHFFSRTDRKVHAQFEDPEQVCIGCSSPVSPKALLAPSLTDEFRIRHGDRSRIYAVGIHPQNTLLLAGHAANACAWIEPETLLWGTTGYYPEGLPQAADQMNMAGRIAELSSKEWKPGMETAMYMHPTEEEKTKGYTYLPKNVLRRSPVANTLVTELALAIQKDRHMGEGSGQDMLLLEYTVLSPKATSDLIESAEQEDMYLALNRDLGYLMEQLTKRIGREKFRMVIFGMPVYGQGENAFKRAGLEPRQFNTERAAALVNTYLMAMYGHERWIDGGYGNSVYLNRTLLEQKKIPLTEIQRQVSVFLTEFEGVETAYPITDVPLLSDSGEGRKLRLSCHKRCMGDVVFRLQPLWHIGLGNGKNFDQITEEEPKVPLMIWTKERSGLPDRQIQATEVKDIILN